MSERNFPMISDLQRAFELADTGRCRTVEGIWLQLEAEGLPTRFARSGWVRDQLQRAIRSAAFMAPRVA